MKIDARSVELTLNDYEHAIKTLELLKSIFDSETEGHVRLAAHDVFEGLQTIINHYLSEGV